MLGKSRLKYIQSLGHKKHRDQEGLFVAEGPKIAEEMLSTMPAQIAEIYAVKEWISERAEAFVSMPIHEVEPFELEKISQLSTANQVLMLLRQKPEPPLPGGTGGLILALDTIQDPGNFGTLIRIADWFGIKQVVCSHSTTDQYNPKVVQSTMGSIGRVQVFYTDLAEWLMQAALPTYAAALSGTPLNEVGKLDEGIVIIGNESKGIDLAILEQVKNRITIPRKGDAESLNAAVAAGIILSQVC